MAARPVILEARGLKKEFRGFVAVDGVDLCVEAGTIHALIGPNGAGKTTCFNLLTKFLPLTSGRIAFDGHDITSLTPAKVARLGLVRSFQISSTFPKLTAAENVMIALQAERGRSFDWWRSARCLEKYRPAARELLATVDLADEESAPASSLPYGRKRALEIATTLALRPRVLLLDEPMAGMSQADVERIAALIHRLREEHTILMVEHNLSVVADLSDRITVLARGKVLAEGDYATVSRDPAVLEAYMGGEDDE